MINSHHRSDILMLLANAFLPDPRVFKEASSLVDRGHRVTILAWDREGSYPATENFAGIHIERIQVQSKFNRRMAQLPRILLLWWRMIYRGRQRRFDIIHCHDLDTLFPAVVLKYLAKRPLIYDAHENYAMVKSASLPRSFVSILSLVEKKLIRYADVVITASTFVRDEFHQICRQPVITLGNYWRLSQSSQISPSDIAAEKRRLEIPEEDLVVGYIGGLKKSRKIEPLLEAVQDDMGVTVLICGAGEQQELVETAARRKRCIVYLGWVPLARVPLYTALADVVYYGLDNYPGALYNSPNALFMAMIQGRALLASDIGDLGKIVRQRSCGIAMKQTDTEEILGALERFQDRAFLQSLQRNAVQAARSLYNWEAAERGLLEIYGTLLAAN
jgi:glycosyltransferase involved in cell wall biosynthesis